MLVYIDFTKDECKVYCNSEGNEAFGVVAGIICDPGTRLSERYVDTGGHAWIYVGY